MRNVTYDFSSVHIDVPIKLAQEIVEWGEKVIPDAVLFQDPKTMLLGREDEPHVTVLYGIHTRYPRQIYQVLRNEQSIHIQLHDVHVFNEMEWFDVVTIKVSSPELERLNAKLRGQIKHFNRYKTYIPHITLAYVEKSSARGLEHNSKFLDQHFWSDVAVFSSKDGSRWPIQLKK